VDYLRRCLSSTDRVLVTWFAPDYFVFSRKGFAAGHALFYPASFATDRDQAVMLDRLSRESVPIVLGQPVGTRRVRARVPAPGGLRRSALHGAHLVPAQRLRPDWRGLSQTTSTEERLRTGAWACGFDAEPAGVLRAQSRGSMTVLVRLARASGAAVLLLALGTAAASHVVPLVPAGARCRCARGRIVASRTGAAPGC
jgi:hypothetical protein